MEVTGSSAILIKKFLPSLNNIVITICHCSSQIKWPIYGTLLNLPKVANLQKLQPCKVATEKGF